MTRIDLPFFKTVIEIQEGGGTIHTILHDKKESRSLKAALDVVEGMILAHAIAGVNVESYAYLEGLETVVDKIFNEYE